MLPWLWQKGETQWHKKHRRRKMWSWKNVFAPVPFCSISFNVEDQRGGMDKVGRRRRRNPFFAFQVAFTTPLSPHLKGFIRDSANLRQSVPPTLVSHVYHLICSQGCQGFPQDMQDQADQFLLKLTNICGRTIGLTFGPSGNLLKGSRFIEVNGVF